MQQPLVIRVAAFCLAAYWGFSAGLCFARAWPYENGQGQMINTVIFNQAKSRFDENGQASLPTDYNKQEMGFHWEHGLSKRTTVVLKTTYQTLNIFENQEAEQFDGIGESLVALRRVLRKRGASVLSAQVGYAIGGDGEFVADAPIGFGEGSIELRGLYGHGFEAFSLPGFVDAQAALRLQSEMHPQDWRIDLSTGIKPSKKTQIIVQGHYVNTAQFQDYVRHNQRLKLKTSLVYEWRKGTRLQLGGFSTIAGKNTVREKGVLIGVWMDYDWAEMKKPK